MKHELQSSTKEILGQGKRKQAEPVAEDERIYLNGAVYGKRIRKGLSLWVRLREKAVVHGCLNANLYSLVGLYGVNEATSEKALALMKDKLNKDGE